MEDTNTPDISVIDAFPNLAQTAEIINVTPNSLQNRLIRLAGRLKHVGTEVRFPPAVVLELARLYRSRDTSEVAGALIDLAGAQAPDFASEIEGQVDVWLDSEATTMAPFDRTRFLADARQLLPAGLYAQVEAALSGGHPPANGGSAASPAYA